MRRFVSGLVWPVGVLTIAMQPIACGAASPPASPDAPGARLRPACPREASRDASGRCACVDGDFALVGACVPAAVGDAFCGPAARIGASGCTFRPCQGDEAIDVATGSCLARATLGHEGTPSCGDGLAPLVESGRVACVVPDATCPRGTRREGARCERAPRCPPGTLPDGGGCRPVVTAGPTAASPRIDLGAWAALALGVDGGPGAPDLCSPLAQRPAAFGLEHGSSIMLNIRLALEVPDQDVSRVHANVAADVAGRPLPPLGMTVLVDAVDTLVEALRSLGGMASTGAVEVRVHCAELAQPVPTKN